MTGPRGRSFLLALPFLLAGGVPADIRRLRGHMRLRRGIAPRAVSSVGRASRLHREGRQFEPVTAHHPSPAILRFLGGFGWRATLFNHMAIVRGLPHRDDAVMRCCPGGNPGKGAVRFGWPEPGVRRGGFRPLPNGQHHHHRYWIGRPAGKMLLQRVLPAMTCTFCAVPRSNLRMSAAYRERNAQFNSQHCAIFPVRTSGLFPASPSATCGP